MRKEKVIELKKLLLLAMSRHSEYSKSNNSNPEVKKMQLQSKGAHTALMSVYDYLSGSPYMMKIEAYGVLSREDENGK
jgi:hypothetical protein